MRARSQVVLPLDLEIKIKKDDRVFLMHEICEQLDYTALYKTYLRKWRKIDPSVIFELIVFGYMNGKYSSRDIEELC
jgi:transposase